MKYYVLDYTEILTLSVTAITVSSTIILIMERFAKLTFINYIDFCFKGGSLYATNCFLNTLRYLLEIQHDSMEKIIENLGSWVFQLGELSKFLYLSPGFLLFWIFKS